MANRRQFVVGAVALGAAAPIHAESVVGGGDPETALRAFFKAFEDCDIRRMESFFATEATYFDRVPPGASAGAEATRGTGMPRGMRELAERLPRPGGRPPDHTITPRDLLIQRHDRVAVCTFHLTEKDVTARRTIVLNRQGAAWKIIHIHASNVARAS